MFWGILVLPIILLALHSFSKPLYKFSLGKDITTSIIEFKDKRCVSAAELAQGESKFLALFPSVPFSICSLEISPDVNYGRAYEFVKQLVAVDEIDGVAIAKEFWVD